jgi:prepilin-type N-terminal cleavage/methylation domain-containing protein
MSRLPAARDERGFTLIELLVALSIGVVVLLGVGTLSTAFLHAQTRVSDRSESIARGRTAMEQVVQELRSQVCLGPGYPAITYGDSSRMTFYADLANTTFVPEQRVLSFASGVLTEESYTGRTVTSPGEDDPPFTFASTPWRRRAVLDRMQLVTSGRTTVPLFRYYSFDANDPIRPANLLSVPLSADDAQRVVQITVSFAALPSRGGGRTAEPFTSNVYVRTADPTDPDHSPLCI